MGSPRAYDESDIRRLAPMAGAIAALRECFSAGPTHVPRSRLGASGGELLVMPAADATVAGAKLLMLQPANALRGEPVIQGTFVLFDATTGRSIALLDGAALTSVRTPAVSALATESLARSDAATLGIVGAGPQALGHVEAMLCVRPGIGRIVVASRTTDHARSTARIIQANVSSTSHCTIVAGSIDDAAGCDIVCTLTRATKPIVDAAMIRPGAHLNAVGSYRADMCELAPDVVAACTVYVDDLAAAREEAGDLVRAGDEGGWAWENVAGDLAGIASGRHRRRDDAEITLFKSVGLAIEDLAVARLVVARDGVTLGQ